MSSAEKIDHPTCAHCGLTYTATEDGLERWTYRHHPEYYEDE